MSNKSAKILLDNLLKFVQISRNIAVKKWWELWDNGERETASCVYREIATLDLIEQYLVVEAFRDITNEKLGIKKVK